MVGRAGTTESGAGEVRRACGARAVLVGAVDRTATTETGAAEGNEAEVVHEASQQKGTRQGHGHAGGRHTRALTPELNTFQQKDVTCAGGHPLLTGVAELGRHFQACEACLRGVLE